MSASWEADIRPNRQKADRHNADSTAIAAITLVVCNHNHYCDFTPLWGTCPVQPNGAKYGCNIGNQFLQRFRVVKA